MEARVNNPNNIMSLASLVVNEVQPGDSCELVEDRRHPRLSNSFRAKLSKAGLCSQIRGVTTNVSQGGAFIRTKYWNAFQLHDQINVTLFIPPSFSGQERTIGLQGRAAVIRLAEDDDGVAVRFASLFRQFERVGNHKRSILTNSLRLIFKM